MHTRNTPSFYIPVLYTLLTVLMTWPLSQNLATTIPGDSFDGWQNYWNLWWIKIALIERIQSPFTTDLLYAPTGVDLYFHTLNPFNGLITLPIQLSLGLIPAYNAVVFLSWVLGGYGVYLLTRWVLRPKVYGPANYTPALDDNSQQQSRSSAHMRVTSEVYSTQKTFITQLAPFCAGMIFTFAPFHMAHLLGHMQVMSLQWIPFYLLALLRAFDSKRNHLDWRNDAAKAGLFLTLSGLCDWYFVLYLFFITVLLVLWHLGGDIVRTVIKTSRRKTVDETGAFMSMPTLRTSLTSAFTTWVYPPLLAGTLFFLLLSPLLLPMMVEATTSNFMVRPATDLYILSASVSDFLLPNRLHTLFRPESFDWIGNQIAPVSERTIGIGYLPLVMALIALMVDRKRASFWGVSAFFFFLLALGPAIQIANISQESVPQPSVVDDTLSQSWTPFALLNRVVPFMHISRSVSRYALMVQLSVAILAGIGLNAVLGRVWNHYNRPTVWPSKAWAIGLLCPLMIVAEYWVVPYPLSPPDTPNFYQEMPKLSGDEAKPPKSVLNLPMNFDRPGYLLYQTVHRQPLTVAYISRDDPRTFTERVPVLQHFRHLGPDIFDIDPILVGQTVLNDLKVGHVVLDRYKMPGGKEREYTTSIAQAIFAGKPPLYEDDRLTVYQVEPVTQRMPYIERGAVGWGPLQRMPDGGLARLLTDEATLFIHGPVLDGQSLVIQYQIEPNASVESSARCCGCDENMVFPIVLSEKAKPCFHAELILGHNPLLIVFVPRFNLEFRPTRAEGNGRRLQIPLDRFRNSLEEQPLFLILTPARTNQVWIEKIGFDSY